MSLFQHSIVSLAYVLFVALASAKELKSDQLNCAIEVPDGWTVASENSGGFCISAKDNRNTIILLVRQDPKYESALDPDSIAEFEQGMAKAGTRKVSSRNLEVDGIPAYEAVHQIGKAPFASTQVIRMTIADHKLYSLMAMKLGDDASEDSQIQACLASFQFLQPPNPSNPSGSGRLRSRGLKLAAIGLVAAAVLFWVIRSRKA